MINDEQRKMIQQEVLEALGSAPELDEIQDNNKYIRFPEKGRGAEALNCWLRVYPYTTRLIWKRGNWRLGREGIWGYASESGESRTWTPEEWREFKQQEQERSEKKEKELQESLKKLREWFDSLPKYGEYYDSKNYGFPFDHSYIIEKGLGHSQKMLEMTRVYEEPYRRCDFDTWCCRNPHLVFPIIGESGLLDSVQLIDNWEAIDGWCGNKRFMKGLPLSGRFYPLFNADSATDKIFACEGFATGLSIFEATNRLTVVCLSCGNLTKGIQGATRYLLNSWKLRETPEEFYKRFIIVADNDKSKAGEEGAIQACKELGCSYVLIPKEGMDANDYQCHFGLKYLREILNF